MLLLLTCSSYCSISHSIAAPKLTKRNESHSGSGLYVVAQVGYNSMPCHFILLISICICICICVSGSTFSVCHHRPVLQRHGLHLFAGMARYHNPLRA